MTSSLMPALVGQPDQSPMNWTSYTRSTPNCPGHGFSGELGQAAHVRGCCPPSFTMKCVLLADHGPAEAFATEAARVD